MSQLRDDLQNLQLGENIFKDVKFFVSGEVHEKVLELLKNGGAERMNYFADYVTHLICGQDAGETDLSDANELYEIPAVTPQWVYVCAKLKKLLNTKSFTYDPNNLFSNFTFCFSCVDKDRNALWAIVTYNGGVVQLNLDGRCTHLVTTDTSTVKYDKAELTGAIAIVTPDWIVESHKNKVLVDAQLFHPKLLTWPKVVKHESTTAITGFEPEQSEFDDEDVAVPDSTQALLLKLKQRMPWNQPPPSQVEAAPTANLQQQQPMVFNQYAAVKTSQVPVAPPPTPPVTRHVVQQFAPTQPVPLQPEQKLPEQFQQQRPIPNRHQLQFRQQSQFNQLLMNQLGRLNQRNPDAQMNHHEQHLKQANQQPQRTLVPPPPPGNQQQFEATRTQQHVVEHQGNQLQLIQQNNSQQQQQQVDQQLLQLRQNQQQNILQHANVPKPVTTIQQQLSHMSQQQQLMNRQIIGQNQHQLKTQQQQILQNQLIQNQEQTNLQIQQTQQQQSQLNQQLQLQNQQNQLAQRHNQLEQQLAQNQLNQQRRLGMGQLNQQHLFQGAIVQSQQLLRQQQLVQPIEQNQLVQQQQQPIRQAQQLVQIQQTQLPLQNQQNGNQQFANPSPVVVNQQQFVQQQHFVSQSQQPTSFNQISQSNQFLPNQPQKQIVGNTQIVTQQQLINQKINVQQQPIMINQGQQQQQLQQSQMQTVQQFNQPTKQRAIGPPHVWQQQQQQPQQPQQINIRHPNVVQQQQQQQQQQGPRVQWLPNQQQAVRQYIHLDTQTHQQLQQMSPEQRALFVAKLQKQRQLQILQSRMQQQRGGHILIRGPGPGLNPQQQMQLLQQHAKQGGGVVFQSNVQQQQQQQQPQQANVPLPQQQPTNAIQQHAAPGLSPIQQNVASFNDQNQQLQRQQFRIQQLQLQREQVQQKTTPTPLQTAPVVPVQQQTIARPVDPNVSPIDPNVQQQQNQLVVNPKTKTALANMLSIRLQSGGSAMTDNIAPEPSAAGTLRLMTAQHNASLISSKRAQELIALQQRKIINALNGELIRPPPAPSAPPAIPQQPEPPKLQYSPRNTIPLQHRPGTYYGHNPNLKLPPDLFLLGCVFVVVELERFLDESQPGWQKKIEKHGGEIEKQYCNRVTHVICETQRHGVVMQALRDFKRCVTLYWLTDVIGRKQVLPPWTALHLPTMYWDTSPASKHLICLSGYTGTERDRVKHMIKYIGAAVTTYFTKHNTLLIVSKAEGPKYFRAKKWGTPVVNTQWLTDVMLGHFSALNQTEHIKYQQFTDPPNFSFDPLLVPNLMHAWKMPINISQESYEKVKRSASPVVLPQKSNKKMKTEHLTDENDNQDNMLPFMPHRVLFSMYADTSELKKIVRQLGGSLASSHKDCTHLVMPQLMRSHKLLHCVCLGTYVLPETWLRDSHAANNFLDESNYSLDTKDFNSEYKCDFAQTLSTKSRNKLFEGKYFFITPSVFPSKSVLVDLIHGCGGIVERTRRTLSQIEATNVNSPYSYIILTHVNDLHLVADLLKNKKDKVRIVCTVELIFSAILRQTFEVEPYAVKVL